MENINKKNLISGKNEVLETLKEGRVKQIFVLKNDNDEKIKEIIKLAKENFVKINFCDKENLNMLIGSSKHNFVVAEINEFNYSSLDDILNIEKNKKHFIIIFDEIEDPHNVGALIRSSVAFGASGIIIKDKNQCPINNTVFRTSTGAINHIKICKVNNITNAIKKLKENNIWVYGTDMVGQSIYNTDLKGNVALVVGNEGKGISKLVKENCDFLVKIPMTENVESLNASVAGAIIMYETFKQNNIG